MHPRWTFGYLLSERFELPNIKNYIEAGRTVKMSVVDYINSQVKKSISWDDAAAMVEEWGGPFAIKGVMSVKDARRAVDIGASAIMISNHGGRQLDGSRAPFDQLQEILDAVGGEIEVIVDGAHSFGHPSLVAGQRFWLLLLKDYQLIHKVQLEIFGLSS